MNYYWFNREKVLKDAKSGYHTKGGEERAATYYAANKEVLREDA